MLHRGLDWWGRGDVQKITAPSDHGWHDGVHHEGVGVAWWADLCKVMAAIQRLKRRQDHLHSRCALEQPSSFLTLASPWVQVGLSDLADRPHRLQGGWGWLWLWLPAPPHALPPCWQVSCLHGSDAARRHQKFWKNIAELLFNTGNHWKESMWCLLIEKCFWQSQEKLTCNLSAERSKLSRALARSDWENYYMGTCQAGRCPWLVFRYWLLFIISEDILGCKGHMPGLFMAGVPQCCCCWDTFTAVDGEGWRGQQLKSWHFGKSNNRTLDTCWMDDTWRDEAKTGPWKVKKKGLDRQVWTSVNENIWATHIKLVN